MKTNPAHSNKFITNFSNLIFDKIFPLVRPAFLPILYITRLITFLKSIIYLMNNESYKQKFGYCGSHVRIYGKFSIFGAKNAYIGNNVHINSNAFIRAEGGLHIDDNVHISSNFVLYTMNHNYEGECLPYDNTIIYKPVHIERNVWIGMNVVVAPGVTIGEGAIIGMGAVVASDIPPYSIVGSAKLREIKTRDIEHYKQLEHDKKYGGMSGYPLTIKSTSSKNAD